MIKICQITHCMLVQPRIITGIIFLKKINYFSKPSCLCLCEASVSGSLPIGLIRKKKMADSIMKYYEMLKMCEIRHCI